MRGRLVVPPDPGALRGGPRRQGLHLRRHGEPHPRGGSGRRDEIVPAGVGAPRRLRPTGRRRGDDGRPPRCAAPGPSRRPRTSARRVPGRIQPGSPGEAPGRAPRGHRMKAVFLLQTDPYRPKPVLRALREADTLHRQGWDVAFVSWIKDAAPPTGEPSGPYLVRRVVVPGPALGTSFVQRALAYYRATSRMSRACVDEKPDLIVAHDFEVLRAGAMAKRRASKPLIYDSHEDWPALIAENSALEARIARAQEKRLCRRVAHVITVSEPIADKFRRMKKDTTVLYNARPESEIHLADREASRRYFGYRVDDF